MFAGQDCPDIIGAGEAIPLQNQPKQDWTIQDQPGGINPVY
jgi:hypothetical protein